LPRFEQTLDFCSARPGTACAGDRGDQADQQRIQCKKRHDQPRFAAPYCQDHCHGPHKCDRKENRHHAIGDTVTPDKPDPQQRCRDQLNRRLVRNNFFIQPALVQGDTGAQIGECRRACRLQLRTVLVDPVMQVSVAAEVASFNIL